MTLRPPRDRLTTTTDAGRAARIGGEGGIRTRGGYNPSHAFQACDLNRSSTSPVAGIVAVRMGAHSANDARGSTLRMRPHLVRVRARGTQGLCQAFGSWIIFIADVINAETSVMLLGTISVVVASEATLP